MSIITREKAIEEVKGALEREYEILREYQKKYGFGASNQHPYHFHDGKYEAYQNVLDMLVNNVRIKEG